MKKRIFNIEEEECLKVIRNFSLDKESFLTEFKSSYEYINTYHATRLDDLELLDIESNGLSLTNKKMMIKKAMIRFINEDDRLEIKEAVKEFIEDYYSKGEHITFNEINFGLLKNFLITKATQYLIYGSETLLPLADSLSNLLNIDFRKRLKMYGKPYLINALIPTTKTKNEWIINIWHYAEYEWPNIIKANEDISLVYHFDLDSSEITKIEEYKGPLGFIYK